MLRNRARWSICLPLLVLTFIGCGGSGRPSLVNVTGKVTLDGKPLADAQVALMPVSEEGAEYQRPSQAMTDANGVFTPMTYGENDGLPLGKYRVAVIKREMVGDPPPGFDSENADNFNLKYQWVTPRKYADPAGSGLEIEVTSSGMQPETIALTTDGQAPEIELTGPQARTNQP